MSLATTLMAVGLPGEIATRLGYEDRVPLDGSGTTQGVATEIRATQTNVALGTSTGDTAFRLPPDAEMFQPYFLLNTTPETALVFPPVGDTIDDGALNESVAVDQDMAVIVWRVEEGRWASLATGDGSSGTQEFATLADAQAYQPGTAPAFINLAGYYAAGDDGGALYRRVDSEPSHAGKFSITLADGGTVVWYELASSPVNSRMFGAMGNDAANDTLAVTNCIAFGKPIYERAGTYRVKDVPFVSNTSITGAGDLTVYRPVAVGDRMFVTDSGSASVADNIENISLRSFKVLGDVAEAGFSQFVYQITLSGVTNVRIDDVRFEGFRGDGLHLASSLTPATERHNKNVFIDRCVFDGVNNDNRNAITVIDGDGVYISDCDFDRCSRSNMPGPVDFEPNNDAFAVIKNIAVRNCRFSAFDGGAGAISLVIPSAVPLPTNVVFEGNVFESAPTRVPIHITMSRVIPASGDDQAIVIRDNVAYSGSRPYRLFSARGVTMERNLWRDCTSTAIIGFTGANDYVSEILHSNNTYQRCGSIGGVGLALFDCDHVTLDGDWFDDCGTGSPGSSNAIDFDAGISASVTISNLQVTAPTGKTLIAVQKEAGHTFTPATNRFFSSELNGLANNFQAYIGDKFTASKTYDPPSLADGDAASTTVTLTGAALGDLMFPSFSLSLQGVMLSAYVSAADTVTCRFQNESGGIVDLGSGTLRVLGVKN